MTLFIVSIPTPFDIRLKADHIANSVREVLGFIIYGSKISKTRYLSLFEMNSTSL